MSIRPVSYKWNKETLGRRSALVFGILLSGGNLLIPRLPLLLLLVGIALITLGLRPLPLRRLAPVFTLLFLIVTIWLIRPGELDRHSLGIRYANFIGAIFLLLIYIKKDKKQLAYDLAWFMPWIVYQTLLTFVISNSLPSLFTSIQTGDGGSFKTIYFVLNYHNLIEDSTGWNRPDSVFFEPGVLQIYLNLLLYVSLFINHQKKDAILVFFVVLSTISTIGTIIAVIQLAIYCKYIWKRSPTSTKRQIIASIMVLSPILLILSINNIEDKFFGESRGSAMARTFDFSAGMRVVEKYPLIGIGFDHKRYIEEVSHLPDFSNDIGYKTNPERQTSNGILNIVYSLGIPISLILFLGLFRQSLLPHKKSVGFMLFICSFSEALLFSPFFMFFIFSGLLLKPSQNTPSSNGSKSVTHHSTSFGSTPNYTHAVT